jgi:hypothetical protein
VHLAVLSALGIAEPLFTELDDGNLFIVLDYGPEQIVLLGLAAVLGPPAVLLLLEGLAGLWSRRVANGLHVCFIAGLAAIFASQLVVDRWAPPSRVHASIAVLAGAAFAVAYAKSQPIRSILTVLAPVPVLFLCLFLFFSPVEKVAFASQGDPPAKPLRLPSPVVMIILDEMQGTALTDASGQIDKSRFPNFARLGQRSTWFRNATTAHSFTDFAVPAIVSGRRSSPDDRPTAVDHPHNIFSLMTGNPMTVQEALTDLCPRSLCPTAGSAREVLDVAARTSMRQWLPRPLADRVDAVGGDNDPPAEAARFVASLGRSDEPALHYLHLLLPHAPYAFLPTGKRHASRTSKLIGLSGADRWDREPWPVIQAHQAFLLQLRYTDRLLGAVLDRLEATRTYDQSLVVLVADHGVSFHPGGSRREVTRDNFEDILSVPFFVKAPGQRRGRVSDQFVRNIDALPTIVDVLGLHSPWRWEGRSVFAPRTDPNPPLDIRTAPGARFSFQARAFVRRRDAAVRAQAARFGTGEASLYRIGPHPGLLGRAPGTARLSDGARVELATGVRPVYDPHVEGVPVRVQGTVVGPRARGVRQIAVALNGRIAATMRTFSAVADTRFTALLPESRLRPGMNRVTLYEISPGPRLARIRAR